LLAWLSRPPCPGSGTIPPADLPSDPRRPAPRPQDAARVVDFISRQYDSIERGSLCEWCLKRELAYWTTYHWPDALCCYAAARDAAGWQLRRTEAEVWELLSAFQECNENAPRP
jgi:hypothetical protein